MMTSRTTHDLAVFVYGRFLKVKNRPSIDTLDVLFQTLFLSSLRTEEGTPLTCSIAYVNPKNPDADPPQYVRDPRWTFTPLDTPIDYSVNELSKIALAADPSNSCLAVYPDNKGILRIWGLIDQQDGFQAWLSHEADGGWSPPGIFHAQILGAGHVAIMESYMLVAELKGDILIESTINVFTNPAIQKKLKNGFDQRVLAIENSIKSSGFKIDPEMIPFIFLDWISIIRRILLRSQAYGHGGAFLITNLTNEASIKRKYKIKYSRIPQLFENYWIHQITHDENYGIISEAMDNAEETISVENYLNITIAEESKSDAQRALTGAVSFAASLSRVDGLVLLDENLVIHGFGCEITTKGDESCKAFQATHALTSKGSVKQLDIGRFGTRHRSMVRYCTEDKESIGFVISHDGPVRAISRINNRLYLWDNLQLALREEHQS